MKIWRKKHKESDIKYPHSTKAIVLGLGINGLGIVRSLGKQGVEVWGVYESENEFGRFSRYCTAIRFPTLKNKENIFLQKLIEDLGDIKEKPVLYAESDLYVMLMSKNRDVLKKYFKFLLPDHELLVTLVSKERSTTFIASKGIRIPETYLLNETDNIEQIIDKIKFPCLMKPIDSFSTDFEKKTLVFNNKKLLNDFLNKHKNLISQVIIQQIIPGGDSNTFQATTYVSKNGEIFPIFTMRKIRQSPPNYGVTSYGISEEIPQIKEEVHKMLTSISYYGLTSIEFKKHPDTDEWFYIELNPRLPSYHKLIYDYGINFPYVYYKDMIGLTPDRNSMTQQKKGIRWINVVDDFGSFAQIYGHRKINIFDWLISVVKSNSYAFYDREDLKPFFFRSIYLMKHFFSKSQRGD